LNSIDNIQKKQLYVCALNHSKQKIDVRFAMKKDGPQELYLPLRHHVTAASLSIQSKHSVIDKECERQPEEYSVPDEYHGGVLHQVSEEPGDGSVAENPGDHRCDGKVADTEATVLDLDFNQSEPFPISHTPVIQNRGLADYQNQNP